MCKRPIIGCFYEFTDLQGYFSVKMLRSDIGVTYILLTGNKVVGFITVSAGEIAVDDLPRQLSHRLPEYPLPVMRIARLAIDKQFQGLGLGKKILCSSFQLALDMKSHYGCVGVVVDAKQESISFYLKLGFLPLEILAGELGDRPQPKPMFLSIKTIEQATKK